MSAKKKKSQKRASAAAAALDFDLAATPAHTLLADALFDANTVAEMRARFSSATPFPHLFIEDFCRVRLLHACHQ